MHVRSHTPPIPSRSTSRPNSTTSIPRPSSGTSRHAKHSYQHTILNPKLSAAAVTANPMMSSINLHKISRSKSSSRGLYRNVSNSSEFSHHNAAPHSDSLLPYNQPRLAESTGTRANLSSRKLSTRLVAEFDDVTRPSPIMSFSSEELKLTPHSNMGQPGRRPEIPPRRLMRPIDPPFPRSQTLNSISGFYNQKETLSSTSNQQHMSGRTYTEQNENQSDMMDALLESQVTTNEVCRTDQTNKEVATNKFHSYKSTILPTTPYLMTQQWDPTRDRSQESEVNFSDSSTSQLRRTSADSKIRSLSPKLSACGLDTNPRPVYSTQGNGYWTGRFVSICDQLRQRDANILLEEDHGKRYYDFGSRELDSKYDKLESTRAKRALYELEKCCMTKPASEGFVRFQQDFLQRQGQQTKVVSPMPRSSNARLGSAPSTTCTNSITPLRQETSHSSAFTSKISTTNVQGLINTKPGSGKLHGLVKSRTTGNIPLASECPSNCGNNAADLLAEQQVPVRPNKPRMVKDFRRRPSLKPDSFVAAMPRGRSWSRKLLRRNRSGSVMDRETSCSDVRDGASQASPGSASNDSSHLTEISSFVPGKSTSQPGLQKSSLSATFDSVRGAMINGEQRADEPHNNTKGTQSKHAPRLRGERQSSGDFMRKVVGASVREVRKISNRMGGLGS